MDSIAAVVDVLNRDLPERTWTGADTLKNVLFTVTGADGKTRPGGPLSAVAMRGFAAQPLRQDAFCLAPNR